MVTRSRNRYLFALALLISMFAFAVALLSVFDIANNRQYLTKDSYFKSYTYKDNLRSYFQNVQILMTSLKDYSQKTENEKLSDLKKQYLKPDDTNLKSILIANDLEYNAVKVKIDAEKALKYYIKDKKSNKVYTNIEEPGNVEDYINKKAVYVDKFPRSIGSDSYLQSINSWFQRNGFEGSFIFIKSNGGFSQMTEDYNYYSSIGERVKKEEIIFIASLVVGIGVLILFKLRNKSESGIRNLYKKIPLDLRMLVFFVYNFTSLVYLSHINFFYSPIGINHFAKLFMVMVYVYYLMISIGTTLELVRSKDEFTAQLKRSICCQLYFLWKESRRIKGTLYKELSLFVFTTLFGMSIAIIEVLLRRHDALFFVAFLYIIVYLLFVPTYILKRVVALNRIIEGTNAIASGNLEYAMEENGESSYIAIAKNINSMKESFKKSVESQVRSERLKTELITNVSHDLKTPLTNIISYVNLLKQGNLSEEQRKKYIEILEQKSQRLRVLIEDLFEASKVSSGAVELYIEKVDIASLLRQALGEFDEKINNSSLTFRTNIPVDEVYLNLDGKRTWRVFENLIGNALKYSQPSSRVYIDLVEKTNKVQVIIKNMSSYELDFDVDEIFERFKRGDKARSTEGSGLGLSIAKSIVELEGGHMKIDIDGDLFKVTTEFYK
ncbi:sensor histidine kinase [Candidatus Clostridium stratigraminis]|uniref:histidine kinase n=1 Tax=Candidatus Clostridium stratigraminis TaxID=3381661 RepID=A0ABW8T4P5_9CLOT